MTWIGMVARSLNRVGSMRTSVAVIGVLLLVGCACRGPSTRPTQSLAPNDSVYDNAIAACLVFDPPVTIGQAPVDLSRNAREPAAFVAYEQLQTTFFSRTFRDRQVLGPAGSERRVVSETVGVSSR